jgi:ATP-dependent DNA ligase
VAQRPRSPQPAALRRQQRLSRLIPEATAPLSRVLVVPRDGHALFDAVQRLDMEGIVTKRRTDPYASGTSWYKIKNPAYTQGEGRWELFHKKQS